MKFRRIFFSLLFFVHFNFSNPLFFFLEEEVNNREWIKSYILFYHQQLDIYELGMILQKKINLENLFFLSGINIIKSDFLDDEIIKQFDYSTFFKMTLFVNNFFYHIGIEGQGNIKQFHFLLTDVKVKYFLENFSFTKKIVIKNNLQRLSFLEKQNILELQYFFKMSYTFFKKEMKNNLQLGSYYRYTFLRENHFFSYFTLLLYPFKISAGYEMIRNLVELEMELLSFKKQTLTFGLVSHPILGLSTQFQIKRFIDDL